MPRYYEYCQGGNDYFFGKNSNGLYKTIFYYACTNDDDLDANLKVYDDLSETLNAAVLGCALKGRNEKVNELLTQGASIYCAILGYAIANNELALKSLLNISNNKYKSLLVASHAYAYIQNPERSIKYFIKSESEKKTIKYITNEIRSNIINFFSSILPWFKIKKISIKDAEVNSIMGLARLDNNQIDHFRMYKESLEGNKKSTYQDEKIQLLWRKVEQSENRLNALEKREKEYIQTQKEILAKQEENNKILNKVLEQQKIENKDSKKIEINKFKSSFRRHSI